MNCYLFQVMETLFTRSPIAPLNELKICLIELSRSPGGGFVASIREN